jgi:hypothetical protein
MFYNLLPTVTLLINQKYKNATLIVMAKADEDAGSESEWKGMGWRLRKHFLLNFKSFYFLYLSTSV